MRLLNGEMCASRVTTDNLRALFRKKITLKTIKVNEGGLLKSSFRPAKWLSG